MPQERDRAHLVDWIFRILRCSLSDGWSCDVAAYQTYKRSRHFCLIVVLSTVALHQSARGYTAKISLRSPYDPMRLYGCDWPVRKLRLNYPYSIAINQDLVVEGWDGGVATIRCARKSSHKTIGLLSAHHTLQSTIAHCAITILSTARRYLDLSLNNIVVVVLKLRNELGVRGMDAIYGRWSWRKRTISHYDSCVFCTEI